MVPPVRAVQQARSARTIRPLRSLTSLQWAISIRLRGPRGRKTRATGRRSQVAKAADCKSAIVGSTPTGASSVIHAKRSPARPLGFAGLSVSTRMPHVGGDMRLSEVPGAGITRWTRSCLTVHLPSAPSATVHAEVLSRRRLVPRSDPATGVSPTGRAGSRRGSFGCSIRGCGKPDRGIDRRSATGEVGHCRFRQRRAEPARHVGPEAARAARSSR